MAKPEQPIADGVKYEHARETVFAKDGLYAPVAEVATKVMEFLDGLPDDAWVEVREQALSASWLRVVQEVAIPAELDEEEDA